MKNLTIENILRVCNGELHLKEQYSGNEGSGILSLEDEIKTKEAVSVVLDSRLVEKGGIFIATKGARVDGHSFISQVARKGVLAVICEDLPQERLCPCILVKDSFQALKEVAGFYRRQLDITVVGITGSVGKTSTKEFIAGVLSAGFCLWKTQGNFNNEIGLPLTILQLREEHRVAVLEMGISQFGEMHRLSELAKPDICVLTNIGQCHLEFLGDRDGVLKAKSEILDFWNPEGFICVNGDDDKLFTLKEKIGDRVVTFGRGIHNDYRAVQEDSRGLRGSVLSIGGKMDISGVVVPLPGEHMVLNALAAAAVADVVGLSSRQIKEGMGLVEAIAGRSHIVSMEKLVLIDDCYNANPASVKAAIDLLQEAEGRRVAILGDMFELGEEELKLHREVGRYAASGRVDLLFCVGRLSEAMAKGAMGDTDRQAQSGCLLEDEEKRCREIHYVETKQELYPLLEEKLLPGDTLLLKASHGMGFSEVVEWLQKKAERR